MENVSRCGWIGKAVLACSLCFCFSAFAAAQSTDQNSPTPITANQISGIIKARDVGDSRMTSYYYLFTGDRGDVFVNVVSSNINGTIDIFTQIGLKPRTKITLFADSPESETGRVVYMRAAEKLILRIQGRTPNDDPGTFQLKFAGSFLAEAPTDEDFDDPRVAARDNGSVEVNSVGTIISRPKEKPETAKSSDVRTDGDFVKSIEVPLKIAGDSSDRPKNDQQAAVPDEKEGRAAELPIKIDPEEPVESLDDIPAETSIANASSDELTIEISDEKPRRSALVTISRVPDENEDAEEPSLEQKLANVQLRIILKGGGTFSRPMNEVLSVNVIKGVLTVVTNDGRIQEFSILEIEKMTIE